MRASSGWGDFLFIVPSEMATTGIDGQQAWAGKAATVASLPLGTRDDSLVSA